MNLKVILIYPTLPIGSSPSHFTDKLTDSKKTYHAGFIWLLNKTHGSGPDENENLQSGNLTLVKLASTCRRPTAPLAKSSNPINRSPLISHSLMNDKYSRWPYTITTPLGYCVGPFSIGFGQSLTPR